MTPDISSDCPATVSASRVTSRSRSTSRPPVRCRILSLAQIGERRCDDPNRFNATRRQPSGRRKRHPSRAACEVGGRRYEATGPGLIYKLATLLWLHGHGGEDFEVWDDRDPFNKPGGLAMTGRARNWARLDKGKLSFGRQAETAADFAPDERKVIAQSAGVITDLMEHAPPAVGEAHTARSRPLDGPDSPLATEGHSTGVATAQRPEAA